MTIRDKLKTYLIQCGLWPDEANVIVAQFVAAQVNKPMKGRWDEDESAYPSTVMAVLLVGLKEVAIKWIDANKPKHFARFVLSGELPTREDVAPTPSQPRP